MMSQIESSLYNVTVRQTNKSARGEETPLIFQIELFLKEDTLQGHCTYWKIPGIFGSFYFMEYPNMRNLVDIRSQNIVTLE